MSDINPKFVNFAAHCERRVGDIFDRFLLLCSFGLMAGLILVCGAKTTQGATTGDIALASKAPNPSVAIADFDGDRRPDLASVQPGSRFFGSNNYWIQLQFSSVGRQSIQVLAPAGGLRIEARDVNGDHAVDLVLSTAWLRQPVAIFLNDGHGKFSRAETSAFPGAFSQPDKCWGSTSTQEAGALATPPQSRESVYPESRKPFRGRSMAGSIRSSNSGFVLSPLLVSHAGRAPPTQVSSL